MQQFYSGNNYIKWFLALFPTEFNFTQIKKWRKIILEKVMKMRLAELLE